MRIVGRVDACVGGQSILVELEAELDVVDTKGAGLETASAHLLSQLVKDEDVSSDILGLVRLDLVLGQLAALDDLLSIGIGKLGARVDDRLAEPALDHLCILVHGEDSREGDLSTPGTNEQSSSLSVGGSMGMARCTSRRKCRACEPRGRDWSRA